MRNGAWCVYLHGTLGRAPVSITPAVTNDTVLRSALLWVLWIASVCTRTVACALMIKCLKELSTDVLFLRTHALATLLHVPWCTPFFQVIAVVYFVNRNAVHARDAGRVLSPPPGAAALSPLRGVDTSTILLYPFPLLSVSVRRCISLRAVC